MRGNDGIGGDSVSVVDLRASVVASLSLSLPGNQIDSQT